MLNGGGNVHCCLMCSANFSWLVTWQKKADIRYTFFLRRGDVLIVVGELHYPQGHIRSRDLVMSLCKMSS